METVIGKHTPETQFGIPVWCHHHCTEMRLEFDEGSIVKIAGSVARVVIARMPDDLFFVDWEIVFSFRAKVNGRVIMTRQDLSFAFGLSQESGNYSSCWFISRYGADVAEQGQYIRWGDFLNIPGPGTGADGDPNVSIKLNEKIKDAIERLLMRPA